MKRTFSTGLAILLAINLSYSNPANTNDSNIKFSINQEEQNRDKQKVRENITRLKQYIEKYKLKPKIGRWDVNLAENSRTYYTINSKRYYASFCFDNEEFSYFCYRGHHPTNNTQDVYIIDKGPEPGFNEIDSEKTQGNIDTYLAIPKTEDSKGVILRTRGYEAGEANKMQIKILEILCRDFVVE